MFLLQIEKKNYQIEMFITLKLSVLCK